MPNPITAICTHCLAGYTGAAPRQCRGCASLVRDLLTAVDARAFEAMTPDEREWLRVKPWCRREAA